MDTVKRNAKQKQKENIKKHFSPHLTKPVNKYFEKIGGTNTEYNQIKKYFYFTLQNKTLASRVFCFVGFRGMTISTQNSPRPLCSCLHIHCRILHLLRFLTRPAPMTPVRFPRA